VAARSATVDADHLVEVFESGDGVVRLRLGVACLYRPFATAS